MGCPRALKWALCSMKEYGTPKGRLWGWGMSNMLRGVPRAMRAVHIPVFCGNSYQAEVYVAWVVLQSRVPSASVWRGATWTFSDSQSYISALESKSASNCPFISALLQPRRSMSSQWEVPHHLYSHLQGTFLDEVLEQVDSYAKDVALR